MVGQALVSLGVRIGRIVTSATCRTRMTGELVGRSPVDQSTDLNPVDPTDPRDWVAVRHALLNAAPIGGSNTLLVSHFHSAANSQDRLFLDMAEIIVFLPQQAGRPLPLARIPMALWPQLMPQSLASP